MAFKIFSRVVISLGVVLVVVVILEFMLLTLCVKEQEIPAKDANVVKATQGSIAAANTVNGFVKLVDENSPLSKESKTATKQIKHRVNKR